MFRRGLLSHALPYLLALLPLMFLDYMLFPRLPFPFARPFLLPLAVSQLALREGPTAGAAYGLLVGLVNTFLGGEAFLLTLFTLLGFLLGLITNERLQSSFFPALLAAICGYLSLSLVRMALLALRDGVSFFALFHIALPEFLFSLPFFPLVYLFYHLAARSRRHRRLPV